MSNNTNAAADPVCAYCGRENVERSPWCPGCASPLAEETRASKPKSAFWGIFLAFFFGPLGLLYSSPTGAAVIIVMAIGFYLIGLRNSLFTLGFRLACIAIAYQAVRNQNSEIDAAEKLLDEAARWEKDYPIKAMAIYEETTRLFPKLAASREAARNWHVLSQLIAGGDSAVEPPSEGPDVAWDEINELQRRAAEYQLRGESVRERQSRTEAAQLLEQYGADAKTIANAWNTVACLSLQAEDYKAAEAAARRSLSIYQAPSAEQDEWLATYAMFLSEALEKQGRLADALPYAGEAVAIFEKLRGPDNAFVIAKTAALEKLRPQTGPMEHEV